MTSAEFVVRPFLGVGSVQELLEGFALDVASLRVAAGGSLTLSPAEYARAEVELVPPIAPGGRNLTDAMAASASEAGVASEDVELIVAVVSRRLKVVDLPVRVSVKELDPSDPSFRLASAGYRPTALRAPYGGCSIEVYLALSRRLDPAPLRPWRKGTWLGRTSFELRTGLGSAGFAPIALTEDLRRDLGLSPGTTRYVEVEDPLEPCDLGHGIRLYVDEALLDALAAAPNTPAARTMQRQLFLDAMGAIVHRASARLGAGPLPSVDEVEGTLLGVLLDRSVVDVDAPDRRDVMARRLAQIARDPGRFMADIEGWVSGLGADMVRSVGREP